MIVKCREEEADNILAEIYSSGLKFVLVNPYSKNGKQKYKAVTVSMYCKDFIQDLIHGMVNNKHISIYGFKFNPSKDDSWDIDKIRILVFDPKKDISSLASNTLNIVNQFEKRFGWEFTKAKEVIFETPSRKHPAVVFTGPSNWALSPPLISLYTLLLRACLIYDKNKTLNDFLKDIKLNKSSIFYGSNDASYLYNAYSAIKNFLNYHPKQFFGDVLATNYPDNISTMSMHASLGIVGLGRAIDSKNETISKNFPHWIVTPETLKKRIIKPTKTKKVTLKKLKLKAKPKLKLKPVKKKTTK